MAVEPPGTPHLRPEDSHMSDADVRAAQEELGLGVTLGPNGEVIMNGGLKEEVAFEARPDPHSELSTPDTTEIESTSEGYGLEFKDLDGKLDQIVAECEAAELEVNELEKKRRMDFKTTSLIFIDPADEKRYRELNERITRIHLGIRAFRQMLQQNPVNKTGLERFFAPRS